MRDPLTKEYEYFESKFNGLVSLLEQPHGLHRMFEYTETIEGSRSNWSASGGFFFFIGGIEAGGSSDYWKYETTSIMMAFENEGNFTIVKIPLLKFRINFTTNPIPTVKFFIKESTKKDVSNYYYHDENVQFITSLYHDDIHAFFNRCLAYVVLSVKEENWPKNIQMPLNPDNYKEVA